MPGISEQRGSVWLFAVAAVVTATAAVAPAAACSGAAHLEKSRLAASPEAVASARAQARSSGPFDRLQDEADRDRFRYPTVLVIDLTDKGDRP